MKIPTNTIRDDDDLVEHEDWAAVLEHVLCKDSAAIECLARLLFTIKTAIDKGPDGVQQASRAILAGIESAYLYTGAHRAALKLYLLSLTGQLKPQDEPLKLINEAIKRSTIEGQHRKKKRILKKKHRSSI